MFALIFGFFFWNALGYFVIEGMEMQMRGQAFPMNINEQIIRPLLSNASVVGLFSRTPGVSRVRAAGGQVHKQVASGARKDSGKAMIMRSRKLKRHRSISGGV
jgi:hypothetical protein